MIPSPGRISNFFSDLPDNLTEELIECLVESSSTRIERIVSQGHATADGEW
jgi:cupin 2 domain-containing protein